MWTILLNMTRSKNLLTQRLFKYSASTGKTYLFSMFFIAVMMTSSIVSNPIWAQADTKEAPTTDGATQANEQEQSEDKEPPPPEPIKRASIDIEANKQTLFAQELDKNAIVTISDGQEDFVSLWQFSRGSNQFGAILLLHGEGQTPDWPGSIDLLRTTLLDFGWSTLSISLPDPLPLNIPARPKPKKIAMKKENAGKDDNDTSTDDGSESNPDKEQSQEDKSTNQDDEETKEMMPTSVPTPAPTPTPDIEKVVKGRITAAINFLNQKGQYNIVVIGEGLGAVRAAKHVDSLLGSTVGLEGKDLNIKTLNQRPIRAMVLLNARNAIPHEEKIITQYLNFAQLPILDIYTQQHYLEQFEPKVRLKQAKKNRMETYVQKGIKVSNAEAFDAENLLVRRVRGFLYKHAKGVEIDKAD